MNIGEEMADRVITKGEIQDLKTGLKYRLSGVRCHENHIDGGHGYCLIVRENKDVNTEYILAVVSDAEYEGSVAQPEVLHLIKLRDFIYEGKEEV